jgi:hypothetical protein
VLFAAVLPCAGRHALQRGLQRLMVPDALHNGRIWGHERLHDARSALCFAAKVDRRAGPVPCCRCCQQALHGTAPGRCPAAQLRLH